VATNKVRVTLISYTPAAAAALTRAYGSALVSVSTTSDTRVYTPISDRFSDTAPFFGGDWITAPGMNGGCTSGWVTLGNVHPDSHWVLTAGHCRSNTWFTNQNSLIKIGTTSTNN
jgi:hypothetical protein